MTCLIILAAVAALITLLLSAWIRFSVLYDENGLVLVLRVGPVRIRIYPRPAKKISVRNFTPAALRRKKRREDRKKLRKGRKNKKALAKGAKTTEKTAQSEKTGRTVTGTVTLVSQIIRIAGLFIKKFGHHLRIDLRRLDITVATADAAQTALTYGIVSQSVSVLLAMLENTGHFRIRRTGHVSVQPDFLSEKFDGRINIVFRIRVIFLFSTALPAVIKAFPLIGT